MASSTLQLVRLKRKTGLALWMERVLEECDHASVSFGPDPVHDLRVALRRCRSVADGIMAIDPDPGWKQLKKAGRDLFRSLGALRDVHVMQEWVQRLGASEDAVTSALLQHLAAGELQFKQEASKAMVNFDAKQWKKWSVTLPRRAARLRPGGAVFKHLALERWVQAHELHRLALRNRSKVAFHNLRIGLKRFRYIVENFLPEQHLTWSADLKELQDLLGDVHDLDVLWATVLRLNAFPTAESRSHWYSRILDERTQRVDKYRTRMLGKSSLWQVWRAALPEGKEIKAIALARLKLWASVFDPDFKHSNHVARLALQLYDALPAREQSSDSDRSGQRAILQLAALLHDVGRAKGEKKYHKTTYKLIDRLTPPFGFSAEDLHLAAVVSRYHRGALPHPGRTSVRSLLPAQRQSMVCLAGILRLADAFDAGRDGRIRRLRVEEKDGLFEVTAQGYSPRDRMAEGIAAARHLLELVYGRPVMVKASPVSRKRPTLVQRN
jgi:CHAD domain-containing protein